MSRREKLEQIAEMERRNQCRIDEHIFDQQDKEHKRSRLAEIEGYKHAKPGREADFEMIVKRYRKELKLED